MAKYDKAYKITIIGDSGVGKTSFISQFAHTTFLEDIPSYNEPVITSIKINKKKMYISLVDTGTPNTFIMQLIFLLIFVLFFNLKKLVKRNLIL